MDERCREIRDSREAELVDDMMEVDEVTFAFASSGALARAANLKASLPIFGFGAKIPFTLDVLEGLWLIEELGLQQWIDECFRINVGI